ncbi:MAG: hypothetical protein ACJ790_22060 [Myxococcaceae bacterium]
MPSVSALAPRSTVLPQTTRSTSTRATTTHRATTTPVQHKDGWDRANDALDNAGKVIDGANNVLDKTDSTVKTATGLFHDLSELASAVKSFIGFFKKH